MFRMSMIHTNLTILIKLLGYKGDHTGGVCFGIGAKAIEAFFADDMGTFVTRLKTLHDLIQKTSIKETAKRIEMAEEKRKTLLETQRQALLSEWKLSPIIDDIDFYKKLNEHKSSPRVIRYFNERKKIENELTNQEKILVDIKAFLDGVLIHQTPGNHYELFDEDIHNYEHNIETSSSLTAPISLSASAKKEIKSDDIETKETKTQIHEHQSTIKHAKAWMGLYNKDRLSQLLTLIGLESKNVTHSFVIQLGNGYHSSVLCYDYKTGKWLFIDSNRLPPIEHHNFNELAKDILASYQKNSFLRFKAYCHENNKLAFQQWFKEITARPKWIALQEIKATNPMFLYSATRYGELEEFKRIYISESKKPGFDPTHIVDEDLLYTAAMYGHLDMIQFMMESKAFKAKPEIINQFNKYGFTPLLCAASNGQTATVKYFLDLESPRVNINAPFRDGSTPLFSALQTGHTNIVKLFLEHAHPKVDLNKTHFDYATEDYIKKHSDIPKLTPFEYAVIFNKPEIVSLFLESKNHTIDVNHNFYILTAAKAGRYDNVNLLIEHKADINTENEGLNLLICAAIHGNHPLITLLNERKDCSIDVNKQDDNGCTALHHAVKNNHIESVRALLTFKNQKIDINALNDDLEDVLSIACANGNKEIVKMLLDRFKTEINPYQVNLYQQSALSNSTWTDNNILPIVLEAFPDIDLNRQTSIGITPFYNAAQNGNIHCFKMLIEKKVDINTPIVSNIGILIEIAKKYHHDDALKRLFKSKGINGDIKGFTPFHAAVFFGHEQIVEELLKQDIDPSQLTEGNISALDFARAMKHQKIIVLLKKHLEASHTLKEEKQILDPSQQEWYRFLLHCEENSSSELKASIQNIIFQEDYLSFPKLTPGNSLVLLESAIKKQPTSDEKHNALLPQLSLLGLLLIKGSLLAESWRFGFFEKAHLYTDPKEAKTYALPSNIKKHIEILDSILKNPSSLKESFRTFSEGTRLDKRLDTIRGLIKVCCNMTDKLPETKPKIKYSS